MMKSCRSILWLIAFACCCGNLFAQGVTIGSNNAPDPAAILDLQTQSKGFLLPRLTTTQRNAIVAPPFGLQIYNSTTDCIECYFASGGWKPVNCGCNSFPNAAFNLPNTGSVNSQISVSAVATNVTYSWTFQGGNPATSVVQSPQVTWANAGSYVVSLTVTDNGGCSSTLTDTITISLCTPFSRTFTNCAATGHQGPTQNQCNSAYGPGVVTVNAGIQTWVVPTTGNYTIQAAGAKGGNGVSGYVGGNGAVIGGTFALTAGDNLKILVGQMGVIGTNGTYGGAGGGGGSFVVRNSTLLIAAGGGGGASGRNQGPVGGAASTGTSGNAAVQHPNETGIPASPGGTGGNGGTAGTLNTTVDGAGGGGYSGNGGASTGGIAFLNGGTGGSGDGKGGFGGGGSSGINGNGYHGGGGGGYSGGGGGSNSASAAYGQGGGGGGSYNTGANQTSSIGNANHGYVTVTFVCPP